MVNDINISRRDDETVDEYSTRLANNKDIYGLTWNNIAALVNSESGLNTHPDTFRKRFLRGNNNADVIDTQANVNDPTIDLNSVLLEINKAKVQLRDERTAANACIRAMAREDTIKEIAHDFAEQMSSKKVLSVCGPSGDFYKVSNEAVLMISDWHYGIEINNYHNIYNTEICKQRVNKLVFSVINKLRTNGVSTLHVFDLSDLIAGRIHTQLRIESTEEVLSQIMHVSEIVAEMLVEFSKYVNVEYYSCTDNHSRIEPNKKESLEKESLCRLTPWYLKQRLKDFLNININDNEFGDDIIAASVNGFLFGGVHGDKDRVSNVVQRLTMHTRERFDVICTAHLHHFSAEETNSCIVLSNPSLMGTDSFAERLRLDATPAQNLIIVSRDNPTEAIYRITCNVE